MPGITILSWLWGLAGRGSANVRLWLHGAATTHPTQVILVFITNVCTCGGGVVI